LSTVVRSVLGCVVFFGITRTGLPEGDNQSPSLSVTRVLASYEDRLRSMKGVRVSLTAEVHQSQRGRPEELVETEELKLNLDQRGQRLRILREPNVQGSTERGIPRLHVEQVVLPDEFINLTANLPDRVVKGLSSKMHVSNNDWEQFLSLSFFSVIFGYLPLEQQRGYIPAIMRAMQVRAHSEDIDQARVTVLEGESTEVDLSLWLDPALNYAPRRITFERRRAVVAPGSIESYAYGANRFHEVDGHFVPSTCDITTTKRGGAVKIPSLSNSNLVLPTGERQLPAKIVHRTVRFEAIDLNPEFSASDFCLTIPIPNGTPVFMRDAANLAFVWQDGEIVPALDKASLGLAKESKFVRGPGATWVWVIVCNAVLLPAVIWLFLRSRVRRRRGQNGGPGTEGGNL